MKLVCETCGSRFEASRRRRFCSRPCRPSERPYAPAPGEVPATGDRAELTALLWHAARKGSVQAMQALRAEVASPGTRSIIDELADRREK